MVDSGKDEATQHFVGLIAVLNLQALMGMGKLADPGSGEERKDLEQARSAIALLEALQVKTEGNLDPEESRYLAQTLTDLRLNYVDEVESDRKGEGAGGGEKESEEKAESAGPEETPAAREGAGPRAGADTEKPKEGDG